MPKEGSDRARGRALAELGPDGLPRVSKYSEYLEITCEVDCGDTFIKWSQTAYLMMMPAVGSKQ
jgi:hypothetical protein